MQELNRKPEIVDYVETYVLDSSTLQVRSMNHGELGMRSVNVQPYST
jgi:hypothetical protein